MSKLLHCFLPYTWLAWPILIMKFPLNPQQNPIQGPCKSSQRNVQEVFIELIKCTWNSMKFPAKNSAPSLRKTFDVPTVSESLPSKNPVFPWFSIVSPWFPCHFPWEHPIPWWFRSRTSAASAAPRRRPCPGRRRSTRTATARRISWIAWRRLSWEPPRCWEWYGDVGMGQYLLIPFLVGWTSIHPSYFGVHQGYYWFWHIPISSVILI